MKLIPDMNLSIIVHHCFVIQGSLFLPASKIISPPNRLLKYFKHRKAKVNYTRSRAYNKNDNAHIEEKNWTVVRQYIGYDRLNNPEQLEL